ncbi:hypothetical protein Ahy_B05g074067 [Arachis hypogaea]|uniref:Transcriptional regulator SLK2 n=1 Tax=Arachis hypogaea TaxID=3818 RepID=A0A444YXV6_ARAHY|nr:hypothetical protein Ahy_B05g074067 [Arachis hypogaea]
MDRVSIYNCSCPEVSRKYQFWAYSERFCYWRNSSEVWKFRRSGSGLALDSYLDSSHQGGVPPMAPSRVAGGLTQSSSGSGIFFQGDGQSQSVVNSHISSSFGNSSNAVPGAGRSHLGPVSGDMNNAVLNSVANSAPSVGASSLVTDANSAFSGGPHLQRSASINTDSYLRLPASPMSFTSNNVSISGSSVMDGSSVVQQSSHQDQNVQPLQQNQQHGASSAMSMPGSQSAPSPLPMGAQIPGSFMQNTDNLSQLSKKPRLDIKQEDLMQQQGYLVQESFYPSHLKQIDENTIAYWRKFVAEYYSPRAKERWCLSLYNNVGHHALGVFPQASMDAWQCDICGSKSGRGFEATFEVLPRLNDIKFGSGVIDELLFLELPREQRFPSGVMMLEYAKAVQESVYEQLRVVREGHLRIIFTQDLKILSWEFCARRHEELLPRRLVAPQVNQLVQVAQKCQSTIAESGSDGVSQQDLQTNSNMVLAAGRQLAKSLELQSLNDLGFSKRYVRCLQISEVVNSMKDLIDICREHKIGAIESLKNYPRFATAAKLQMQKMHEMEQLANVQGLPTDRNTINKLMAMNPSLNNPINNNPNMINRGGLSGSAQAALALNYQSLLMRQNSMNSSPGSIQREGSSSFNNANQSPSSAMQGATSAFIPGSMQNSPIGGFPSPHLPPQQQQQQPQQHLQQRSLSANSFMQQNHSQGSQGNQALQQQMIQQLLMSNNNGGVQSQSLGGPNANGSIAKNGLGFGGHSPSPSITGGSVNVSGNKGPVSRSNSFKSASNSDSSPAGGNNGFNPRTSDIPQNLHLQDVVPDIASDFTDSPFFSSDLDDNMGFGWKA